MHFIMLFGGEISPSQFDSTPSIQRQKRVIVTGEQGWIHHMRFEVVCYYRKSKYLLQSVYGL